MSSPPTAKCGPPKPWLNRLVPALDWLRHYERMHLLLAFQYLLPRALARWKAFPDALAQTLSKSGPIIVVVVGTASVAALELGARTGVTIIGEFADGSGSNFGVAGHWALHGRSAL